MASVTGWVGLGESSGAATDAAGAGAAGVEISEAICRNCTACGRDCNRGMEVIFTGGV
jgi:hypothetical protein